MTTQQRNVLNNYRYVGRLGPFIVGLSILIPFVTSVSAANVSLLSHGHQSKQIHLTKDPLNEKFQRAFPYPEFELSGWQAGIFQPIRALKPAMLC